MMSQLFALPLRALIIVATLPTPAAQGAVLPSPSTPPVAAGIVRPTDDSARGPGGTLQTPTQSGTQDFASFSAGYGKQPTRTLRNPGPPRPADGPADHP